jgi:hypothetical protein
LGPAQPEMQQPSASGGGWRDVPTLDKRPHGQAVAMRAWIVAVAATVTAALTGGAYFVSAQDRPAPPLLSPAPNLGCQARTGGLVLPRPGETTGNANLSDELSRSKGVICPPAGVDPGISAPPVGGGVTPVIPPPGTPGGDPGLAPK